MVDQPAARSQARQADGARARCAADAGLPQGVGNAGDQRRFRSNDDKLRADLLKALDASDTRKRLYDQAVEFKKQVEGGKSAASLAPAESSTTLSRAQATNFHIPDKRTPPRWISRAVRSLKIT